MKTIKTLIEIPSNFKWKAQDRDGNWYAYTKKPFLNSFHQSDGMWDINMGGECINIGYGDPNPNWKNTLQRIEEYEEV